MSDGDDSLKSMQSSKVNHLMGAYEAGKRQELVSASVQVVKTETPEFTWSLWSQLPACKISV